MKHPRLNVVSMVEVRHEFPRCVLKAYGRARARTIRDAMGLRVTAEDVRQAERAYLR